MVRFPVGVVMGDMQPSMREKAVAYFALCTFRLGLVVLAFLAFWLSTWVSLETAGTIAGLMALVVLGGTAYEVFISRANSAQLPYKIIVSLLIVAAISLPLVGSAQFWPALISTLLVSGLITMRQPGDKVHR